MRRLILALPLVALLGGCFGPPKDEHPNQVLTKRRAVFKQYTRIMEPIGLVAAGRKDYQRAEFLQQVQDLATLADKPWQYFPADGNYPPTRSKPEVWSQPERFRAAQEEYRGAVQALLTVAQEGAQGRIADAVRAVDESCKSCHRAFRNE